MQPHTAQRSLELELEKQGALDVSKRERQVLEQCTVASCVLCQHACTLQQCLGLPPHETYDDDLSA